MANQAKLGETTFGVGDLVKVHLKIQEGDKIRTQPLEGLVIAIKGRGDDRMFTVRRIAAGSIGVERILPLNSPWVAKIEVKKKGQVRRAKLYYLRKRTGKGATRVRAKAPVVNKKKEKSDDRVKRGKHRVKRDEKKKPGKSRRKPRPKTSS